jgi:flap endonuclease-1
MGLPVVQAASEGEAQCAWLAKNRYVEGVIGEDIDTLVFGAPLLLRNFNRGSDAVELSLAEILSALGLTHGQFIDFCILCGCDYTAKIPMIGPVKALALIKAHHSLEGVVEELSSNEKYRMKHPIPDDFNYLIARRLFQQPTVKDCLPEELARKPLQEEALREFLMQRDFDQVRVDNWISKMKEFDNRAGHLI